MEPVLITADLGRRYGERWGIRNLSFELGRGEVVGLLGPNGSGKTTTAHLLVGLLKPDEGGATAFGLDCFSDREAVLRSTGFVQDSAQWPPGMSARQLLAFAAWSRGMTGPHATERVAELLASVDLSAAADRPAAEFSAGMGKRLGIAMALLSNPDLLLLDEPSAGLDPAGRAWVEAMILQRKSQGAAVILSTHLLDHAERVCDRVVLLDQGSCRAQGSPGELLETTGTATLREAFLQLTSAP